MYLLTCSKTTQCGICRGTYSLAGKNHCHKRSYRDSLPKEEALAIMESGRGAQFDPVILDIFMEIIEKQST